MEKWGLIAGTGFSDWLSDGQLHQLDTPYGQPSAAVTEAEIGNSQWFYLPRHGNPHRLAPHTVNYRANIWALHSLGVSRIVAVNVVGSIRKQWPSGSLVVPDQIIDYTWGRAHTYFDVIDMGDAPVEHIDFTHPYSLQARQLLLQAGEAAGLHLFDGGCYAATQGPRLESAAEVQRIRRDGGDIIGMTGMPEAALARELGVEYASICLVSNAAAGIDDQELSIAQIMQNVHNGSDAVLAIMQRLAHS